MFSIGQRVAIAPHHDVWMMGERWGTVTAVGRKWITVKGFRSGRKFKFLAAGDSLS